jgi:hypothetical protein
MAANGSGNGFKQGSSPALSYVTLPGLCTYRGWTTYRLFLRCCCF